MCAPLVRCFILAWLLVFPAVSACAAALVADLSEHRIQIDLGFTGKQVLLYGAIEGDGDVAVVVLSLIHI